jgi:hypothetical protein
MIRVGLARKNFRSAMVGGTRNPEGGIPNVSPPGHK